MSVWFISLPALAQLVERTAAATAVGCIVGRLILPTIWKDVKRTLRKKEGDDSTGR